MVHDVRPFDMSLLCLKKMEIIGLSTSLNDMEKHVEYMNILKDLESANPVNENN